MVYECCNQSFCQGIQIALKAYLTFNTTPEISPVTCWEACKPVIRGTFIQMATQFKRDNQAQLQQLERDFQAYHSDFRAYQSTANRLLLDKAKTHLDLFVAKLAEKVICRSHHTHYDSLLALQLRKLIHGHKPIGLKISKHTYSSNPLKLLHEFRKHLSYLYAAKGDFF